MARNDGQVVIYAVGDVGPRRIEYGEPIESLFEKVANKLKEADIRLCQLERTFSDKGWLQYRSRPTTYKSRVHPDNVKSLVHAGFDLVTHASNHCFDYGPEALVDSIEVLGRNGIKAAGVGRNIEEARSPVILERKGTRIAFLDYNSVLPEEYEAREDKPGCAPLKIATYYEPQEFEPGTPPKVITIPRAEHVVAMETDIKRAKEQADVVVVSFHWGIHFVAGALADYQFVVGHKAIDAGADLILGSHPHIIKGIEVYKRKVIFYSLGNFAEESPHHLPLPPGIKENRMSKIYRKGEQEISARYGGPIDKHYAIMASVLIRDKTVNKVSFVPIWINDRSEPKFTTRNEPEFQQALDYTKKCSRGLGTEFTVAGDEVVVWSQ